MHRIEKCDSLRADFPVKSESHFASSTQNCRDDDKKRRHFTSIILFKATNFSPLVPIAAIR